mmetsp:Transcript_94293/g.275754  ORF Transcript_94293/g.275754 Transcript_94293/m.275754 type:complete len:228 (+) Transcript_94293:300-983(+)
MDFMLTMPGGLLHWLSRGCRGKSSTGASCNAKAPTPPSMVVLRWRLSLRSPCMSAGLTHGALMKMKRLAMIYPRKLTTAVAFSLSLKLMAWQTRGAPRMLAPLAVVKVSLTLMPRRTPGRVLRPRRPVRHSVLNAMPRRTPARVLRRLSSAPKPPNLFPRTPHCWGTMNLSSTQIALAIPVMLSRFLLSESWWPRRMPRSRCWSLGLSPCLPSLLLAPRLGVRNGHT